MELVERGKNTPVNETLDWCSPAFFISKGDKIRTRLMTAYTELNKHVNRPIYLFAHMTEILQAIPPEAKIFTKMDTVHGYFQMDKASHLSNVGHARSAKPSKDTPQSS